MLRLAEASARLARHIAGHISRLQPRLPPLHPLASISAALCAAAAAYLLGSRHQRLRALAEARSRWRVCECGASLECASAQNEAVHRKSLRHRRNMAALTGTRLVVAENWAEYRRVASTVSAGARVCEVGCGRGVTTALLAARCGADRVVGFDLSEKVVSLARQRYPHVDFRVADAMDISAMRRCGQFDQIFVDINGSRELETVLPLIEAYEKVLKPAVLVVKNVRLKQLVLKCRLVAGAANDGGVGFLDGHSSALAGG